MTRKTLTLDFFHDVVCGWCFNTAPRLHALTRELDLDIHHHTFVLQDNPEQMIAVFGSMEEAKHTILGHWAACKAASDTPEAFNIEDMRAASFDYPYGLPGALACKAAERIEAQAAHWRLFDVIQGAHLTDARNVADQDVLTEAAVATGFERNAFERIFADAATRDMVEAERTLARQLLVTSVPTIIARETGTRLVNATLEDLHVQLLSARKSLA